MQPNFKHLEVSQVQIQDGHQGSYYSPWQDTGTSKSFQLMSLCRHQQKPTL